jgi:hypothetical protein
MNPLYVEHDIVVVIAQRRRSLIGREEKRHAGRRVLYAGKHVHGFAQNLCEHEGNHKQKV